MSRFCELSAWLVGCLGVALLLLGTLAMPEPVLGDGGSGSDAALAQCEASCDSGCKNLSPDHSNNCTLGSMFTCAGTGDCLLCQCTKNANNECWCAV